MNIILLEDIPERGKHWKKGQIVYGIDPAFFKEYLDKGIVKEFDGKEPIWKSRNEEEE